VAVDVKKKNKTMPVLGKRSKAPPNAKYALEQEISTLMKHQNGSNTNIWTARNESVGSQNEYGRG